MAGIHTNGMLWKPAEKSGFLLGVGERAGNIASQISESGTR